MTTLLERGINVNYQITKGWSALHYAVIPSNHDVIQLLLDYGASDDLILKDGTRPSDIADN